MTACTYCRIELEGLPARQNVRGEDGRLNPICSPECARLLRSIRCNCRHFPGGYERDLEAHPDPCTSGCHPPSCPAAGR